MVTQRCTYVGNNAFTGLSNLKSFSADTMLTEIGNNCFRGDPALSSVSCSYKLKTIGNAAFEGCTALTSIDLTSVTTVEGRAFMDCSALSDVDLSGLESIGYCAFSGCSALTSIKVTAAALGRDAFSYCTALKTAELSVFTADSENDAALYNRNLWESEGLFYGCEALTSVQLGYEVTRWPGFDGCEALTSISIDNSAFRSEENDTIVYTADGTELVWLSPEVTSVELPETLTTVKDYSDYTNLTELRFYGARPAIYSDAFSGLTLTCKYPAADESWVPEQLGDFGGDVTWISVDADGNPVKNDFVRWEFVYTDDGKQLTIVGTGSMFECYESDYTLNELLSNEYIMANAPWYGQYYTSVFIGDGITDIPSSALSDASSCTSVTVGSGVRYVGYFAFWDDGRNQDMTITFTGDAPSFNAAAFSGRADTTCCYPADNETWVDAVFQNYHADGTITWIGLDADGNEVCRTVGTESDWDGYQAPDYVEPDSRTPSSDSSDEPEDAPADENDVAVRFDDVGTDDWFRPYVQTAFDRGIMTGKSETTFDPKANLTRAEAAVVALKLAHITADSSSAAENRFADVDPTAWYAMYINTAAENGLVSGYEDGTVHPTNNITRAEFAVMLLKALKLDADEYADSFNPFTDNDQWSQKYILAAYQNGLLSGYEDSTVRPGNNITRAEVAVMASKALDL